MEIVFTPADNSRLDTLLELMSEFYVIEHLNYDETVIRNGLMEMFNNSSYGKAYIIMIEDKPAGYFLLTFGFSLEFHGRDALVDEFYIKENYRNKGLGTASLQFMEKLCKAEGIHAMHLEVDRTNLRAKELYHRSGYYDHNRYLLTKWLI